MSVFRRKRSCKVLVYLRNYSFTHEESTHIKILPASSRLCLDSSSKAKLEFLRETIIVISDWIGNPWIMKFTNNWDPRSESRMTSSLLICRLRKYQSLGENDHLKFLHIFETIAFHTKNLNKNRLFVECLCKSSSERQWGHSRLKTLRSLLTSFFLLAIFKVGREKERNHKRIKYRVV